MEYVEAGKVGPATRSSYRTAMRRILETIGTRDALTLTTADLIVWHASIDVSPRAANIALTALSSILQRAVEWGMLDRNAARGVKRHRETRRTVHIPTPGEVARLGMTAPGARERGMLLVACYAGLRQGELRALTTSDLYHGRIRVQAAAVAGNRIGPTKTYEERVVPIPDAVREWLTAYCAALPSGSLMFPGVQGRVLDKDVWRRDAWHPWRADAGCEHLLWRHLRHYYASTLSSIGASLLQCSRWMGHATITTTMDRYGFLFDHDESRVMDLLDSR